MCVYVLSGEYLCLSPDFHHLAGDSSGGSLKAGNGLGPPLVKDHLVFSWGDTSVFQLKSSGLWATWGSGGRSGPWEDPGPPAQLSGQHLSDWRASSAPQGGSGQCYQAEVLQLLTCR